jgi:hypothetical protein
MEEDMPAGRKCCENPELHKQSKLNRQEQKQTDPTLQESLWTTTQGMQSHERQ